MKKLKTLTILSSISLLTACNLYQDSFGFSKPVQENREVKVEKGLTTEMPEQFQGEWDNGNCDGGDACRSITLGKNWIIENWWEDGRSGEIIKIEELDKDHISVLVKFTYGELTNIYRRAKERVEFRIINGKLQKTGENRADYLDDNTYTKISKDTGKYKSWSEDIWQIPTSLNDMLFIDRVLSSMSNVYDLDGNIVVRKAISKNDRYFINTNNGIQQISINDSGDKRYVEIPDGLEYKNVFIFTKINNIWHLDKQEQQKD